MMFISIVTACYNEEGNVDELCSRIRATMEGLPNYSYEHILIDNHSTDETVSKIRDIAAEDKRVKLIVNARNFGHVRSGYYGLLQAQGEAAVFLSSDLQDPPEMIPEFIQKWEEGAKIVMAVKPKSAESGVTSVLRSIFYGLIDEISEVPLIQNATGAGLYDKTVIAILRTIDDPYPYFRGLVCEIGFPIAEVKFEQPRRKSGLTKNNFFTLFDLAMLGIVKHSKVPLRLMTIGGIGLSMLSFFILIAYLIAKLMFWDSFSLGIAPILVGVFFYGSVQMFFLGLLGEYVGSIHTHVRKMPLVIELERVNFDDAPDRSR